MLKVHTLRASRQKALKLFAMALLTEGIEASKNLKDSHGRSWNFTRLELLKAFKFYSAHYHDKMEDNWNKRCID